MSLVLTTEDNIKIHLEKPEKNYTEKTMVLTVPGPVVTQPDRPDEKKPDLILKVNLSPGDLAHLKHMLSS